MSEARVIVFGGDGYCGWPTALHLSAVGMDVVIAEDGAGAFPEVTSATRS